MKVNNLNRNLIYPQISQINTNSVFWECFYIRPNPIPGFLRRERKLRKCIILKEIGIFCKNVRSRQKTSLCVFDIVGRKIDKRLGAVRYFAFCAARTFCREFYADEKI